MTCATGGGLGGEGVCFWGLKQRLWHYICGLLLCFPVGLLPLSYKFQLALPAVQVCFACGLLCLCWLFAVALWSVRSVFVCGLLWRRLWLLCGHWLINHIGQYSERPVLTLFGLDVCAVLS